MDLCPSGLPSTPPYSHKPATLSPSLHVNFKSAYADKEQDLYNPILAPDSLRDPSFFTQLIMSTKLPVENPRKPSSQHHQYYYRPYSTCHSTTPNSPPTSPTINSPPFSSHSFEPPQHQRPSASDNPKSVCFQAPIKQEPILEHHPPPPSQASLNPEQVGLEVALRSKVTNSIGQEIEFGEVLDPKFRTVVIFIRHFRCGYCQQYIRHLSELTTRDSNLMILKSRIKIVIIGQGHHEMIGPYRALYNCPFPIYSDSNSHHPLFNALGMTPKSYSRSPDLSKCSYLDRISVLELLLQTIKNATKMPLKYGGDLRQSGGEFVFEPVPQHRIRRKPIRGQHSSLPGHPLPPPLPPSLPSPTVSKPARAFLQSQILVNFANHVNQLDSATSSTSSSSTARSTSSTVSNSTANTSLSSSSASYSVWSESSSEKGRERKVRFQCRFVHRMRNFRDHAALVEVFMAAGLKLK